MSESSQVFASKTYLFREHPYFYASLSDLAPGMGLLQIHSDWGTYSAFWPAMGEDTTLAQFLLSADSSYIETNLARTMGFMGMKRESYIRLSKFMAHCWPRLRTLLAGQGVGT